MSTTQATLRQSTRANTIRHNLKLLKVKQNVTKGECIPFNKSRRLLCQQAIATTTIGSPKTKNNFDISQSFL